MLHEYYLGKWHELPSSFLVYSSVFEMRFMNRTTVLVNAKAIHYDYIKPGKRGFTSACSLNSGFLLGLFNSFLTEASRIPLPSLAPQVKNKNGLRATFNFYAENGQDVFLFTDVFKQKQNGVFIEAGAFSGTDGSNVYFFERYFNWSGLCFEPDPSHHANIKRRRSCRLVPKALCNVVGEAQFMSYKTTNALGVVLDIADEGTVASRKEWSKSHENKIINISCTTLAHELNVSGITHVDLVSLDVEGSELQVLSTLSDQIYSMIDYFLIEMSTENITLHMIKHGFQPLARVGSDCLFGRK